MRRVSPGKLIAVACACILVAACDQRQPKLSNEQVQKLKAAMPGITDECLEKVRWAGIEALPSGIDKCFKMERQRRWSGLYVTGFEWSRFCPAPAQECSDSSPGEYIKLVDSSATALPGYVGEESPPLYTIEFVGRKTVFPIDGPSVPIYEMLVDRLISIKRIEAPKQK
jgi:hypothetical protein